MDNGRIEELTSTNDILKSSVIRARNDLNNYDLSDDFKNNDNEINTVTKLVAHLDNSPNVEADGYVLCTERGTNRLFNKRMNKKEFVEAYKNNTKKFREAVDYFGTNTAQPPGATGDDFIPLLGGPFNKQLYLYDYLKMHATCFHAVNHDPTIKAAVDMIINFVLGRGFRVDSKDKSALAIWRSFEEANKLQDFMRYFLREHIVYGENFIWWLPNNETKITYQVLTGQESPKGLLPRIKMIDPSTIWEIVTYPEDMSRVLYYQMVFNTQYQIYTGMDGGKPVSSSKFIYQQIPEAQVMHYKSNCMSNEKRGRSDLFSILGYAKRLRDSVNYSLIAQQKNSAWAIDTEIDGSQQDIDAYVKSQQELGTIPNAGSEFVHSTKVKRTYLNNAGAKGGTGSAFEESLSMICMGLGIPQSYFGTHISGGTTKASAFVGTEPVTKKFEERQQLLENVIQDMAKKLFEQFGINAEIEVTFPDLITDDRSAKLKDLALSEQSGWISHERAANIAAKELSITEFDWFTEKQTIEEEKSDDSADDFSVMPLTSPPSLGSNQQTMPPKDSGAITGQDRKDAENDTE